MARTIKVPRRPMPERHRSVAPRPSTVRTVAEMTAKPVALAPEVATEDALAALIKSAPLVEGPLIGNELTPLLRNGKLAAATAVQIAGAGTSHDGGGRGLGRRAFRRNLGDAITISTSAPSGGQDGDLWFTVLP